MSEDEKAPAMSLGEAFRTVTGQELSEAGEAGLRRFADAAGIKSNDALWLILFGFEQYRNLYAAIPEQVAGAVSLIVREQAEMLEAQGERVKARISEVAAERANETIESVHKRLLASVTNGEFKAAVKKEATEAMQGPVMDAAVKLERLSKAAENAMDRYAVAHRGINQWLTIGGVGLVAGFFGALAALLIS